MAYEMDYERAAAYWLEKDASATTPEREVLQAEVEAFIEARNTCALATADLQGNVRCTPIEYTYWQGCFWMLSEGGLKFRGLAVNKNVSLAIYDTYKGFGALGGMQVAGVASIVEPWSDEYLALLDHKGLAADALRALPNPMHLIKVTPTAIDFLNSELRSRGFDSRAHLECVAGE